MVQIGDSDEFKLSGLYGDMLDEFEVSEEFMSISKTHHKYTSNKNAPPNKNMLDA